MSAKAPLQLENVQKTLLLPLWGRAVETQKKKPLLHDPAAAEIIGKIDYNFSRIALYMSPITRLAWIARSLLCDRTIRNFLRQHPSAAIVNIGCGMDTTFERVDNGTLSWYDLDLPPVISLRRELLREDVRRKFLATSFLDDGWFRQLNTDDGVMFIAAGVFYYFDENDIRKFFNRLADNFPDCEVLFDACSPLGVRVANRKVIESSGMGESARLRWGINSAKEIRRWDPRFVLVDEYPLFKYLNWRLKFREMAGTFFSDRLNIMFMAHLRLAERSWR